MVDQQDSRVGERHHVHGLCRAWRRAQVHVDDSFRVVGFGRRQPSSELQQEGGFARATQTIQLNDRVTA
jgi:hypothetical protein